MMCVSDVGILLSLEGVCTMPAWLEALQLQVLSEVKRAPSLPPSLPPSPHHHHPMRRREQLRTLSVQYAKNQTRSLACIALSVILLMMNFVTLFSWGVGMCCIVIVLCHGSRFIERVLAATCRLVKVVTANAKNHAAGYWSIQTNKLIL